VTDTAIEAVAEAARRFAASYAEFWPDHPAAIADDLEALERAVAALSGPRTNCSFDPQLLEWMRAGS
jgi:hypothetical protein